jgi:stage V sporulation protein G
MEATEVRVKLAGDKDDKLKAFCTITFDDCFVVRDLKIIRGSRGVFVAMPSRKLTDLCPKCRCKNHLRAQFCNDCGHRLDPERAPRDEKGRAKLHADIAHPIHADFREYLQDLVLDAYAHECERARDPNYRPSYDFEFDTVDGDGGDDDSEETRPAPPPPKQKKPPSRFGEGILP